MSDAVKLVVTNRTILETFSILRECGCGQRECQVLWTSQWAAPARITDVVHTKHRAGANGFDVDSLWLTQFSRRLLQARAGVRVQIHTHPGEAFHSTTDDEWPIVHTPGFLSLVLPNFAFGEVGFRNSYLSRMEEDGKWRQVAIQDHIIVLG